MKYQVLFSLKSNLKYLQMSSASVMIGALRVKVLQNIKNEISLGICSLISLPFLPISQNMHFNHYFQGAIA